MTMEPRDLSLFGNDVRFGYLDRTAPSSGRFQPQLVLNSDSDSMLRALRRELRYATAFTFSVAFVSSGAIALLKQELIDFGRPGRIITSNYLGFNSPRAFAELLGLKQIGIDVRIHEEVAFHPKGYVFQHNEGVTAILGSSNLTESALATNHEWNLRVSATSESDLSDQFLNLLDEQLHHSTPLTQEWIDAYAEVYQPPVQFNDLNGANVAGLDATNADQLDLEVVPNSMQIEALTAIDEVRARGNGRALVISATGTGKTILSALDVREFDPKRLLFIAHREQILDRAMREFQRVLRRPRESFGKLAGSSRDVDRAFVFATVQTLSRPEVLQTLDPNAFDYILVDEVHRAGAESYARVLKHFTPTFLLGMTATPERSDGESIFELFDFNVPYEIRLGKALELDMLAPFHYYGVADLTFEDGTVTDDTTALSYLVASERIDHVLSAIEKYTQAGVAARGLIFCSRKDEAYELAGKLNVRSVRGILLRTVALTGEDSIETRERCVEQLERGELDYIITVDVFNEGVDIPSINQVIMLRQTQSSIVFVQQLGRGLRKSPGKDYLVVIDFIGNYNNNYMIPIALFGDDSLNKESLRKNLIAAEEIGVVAGVSSVRFDRVAQERVLRSLAESKLDSLPNLKIAIETIRNRVGRTPRLADFLRFESVDPVVLATRSNNYAELLARLKIELSTLTEVETRILTFVSNELLTAKRPNELLLLQLLLDRELVSKDEIREEFETTGASSTGASVESSIRSLTLEFNTASEVEKYGVPAPAIVDASGGVRLEPALAEAYARSKEFRGHLDDVIETGLYLDAARYVSGRPFTPERMYSRKDASRLLDWSSNMYSTIYGYKVDGPTRTCPIFVTLNKSGEVSASTAYEDELLTTQSMLWYSKNRRNLGSRDVSQILSGEYGLHIFAKKSDVEGSDYYYLGEATAHEPEESTIRDDKGQDLPIVRMRLLFEEPIQAALYDYFHTEIVPNV